MAKTVYMASDDYIWRKNVGFSGWVELLKNAPEWVSKHATYEKNGKTYPCVLKDDFTILFPGYRGYLSEGSHLIIQGIHNTNFLSVRIVKGQLEDAAEEQDFLQEVRTGGWNKHRIDIYVERASQFASAHEHFEDDPWEMVARRIGCAVAGPQRYLEDKYGQDQCPIDELGRPVRPRSKRHFTRRRRSTTDEPINIVVVGKRPQTRSALVQETCENDLGTTLRNGSILVNSIVFKLY
jgi:hypothetical protein